MSKVKKTRRVLRKPRTDLKQPNDAHKYFFSGVVGSLIGHMFFPGIGGIVTGGSIGLILEKLKEKEVKMTKIPVFYSFHFGNDVMRVQQIRNIGAIEGNQPTTPNDWEKLKRSGDSAVKNWIEENMKYKRCIIVLIGSETASRKWVEHEIIKAWNDGKALLGINIHNIKCPRNGTCKKGENPFEKIKFSDGRKLSNYVSCYDPSPSNAYADISANISQWIQDAIANKAN